MERLYRRYEHRVPLLLFVLGFLWDALTLSRVDNVLDHVVLLSYLAGIAAIVYFTLRRQLGARRPALVVKLEPYFPAAMQFAFGALFSSFVIFYFRSVSWTRTLFFFALLVALFIANEFLRDRLEDNRLLAALFFVCLFTYLALLIPTVLSRVGAGIFLLAGVASLAVFCGVFGSALLRGGPTRWARMRGPGLTALGLYLGINALYFGDLMPPVPLALRSAGIYHQVTRTPGGYEVKFVAPPLWRFWRLWDNPFELSAGEPVFCYTAVFAPRRLRVPVRHVWSYHSEDAGWTVTDRIAFEIAGGREEGYRGYTRKQLVFPGRWRVEVQTYDNRTLGRIDFTIVESPSPHPPLTTRLIEN